MTWSEAGYKGVDKEGKCRYFYIVPHVALPGSLPGVKIGYHRQGALLSNQEEFIVSAEGAAAVSGFPHLRKQLVQEQDLEMDQFGLEQTQTFVRDTLPLLDPDKAKSVA